LPLAAGNGAAGEKKKEPGDAEAAGGGKPTGLANYEATLGKWLGSKLYAAVSKEITLDKMSGHADSAFASAVRSLGGYVKGADKDVDPGQVDKAVAALLAQFGKEAGKFVQSEGAGLQGALAGWVDANPELIVTLALLAAAGAVAANMEIPELSQKIGLADGLDARVSVRLGKLRDITLEKIEAKLAYKAGQLSASFTGALEGGDQLSAGLGVGYEVNDKLDLNLRGTWSEKEGGGARLGLNYNPRKDLSIGAHVGYDEKTGANAGVGVTLRF